MIRKQEGKKIVTAFFALLLMSNISFAKATGKKPYYADSLKVRQGSTSFVPHYHAPNLDGHKKRPIKLEKIVEKLTYAELLGNIEKAGGVLRQAQAKWLQGDLIAGEGTLVMIAGGGLVGCAISLYGHAKSAEGIIDLISDDIKFFWNGTEKYPSITNALAKSSVFSGYRVVLVDTGIDPDPNDQKMNKATREQLKKEAQRIRGQLVKFLKDPYKNPRRVEIKWEKGYKLYSFFFDAPDGRPDLANTNIYADVSMTTGHILVRSTSARPAGKTKKENIKPKRKQILE